MTLSKGGVCRSFCNMQRNLRSPGGRLHKKYWQGRCGRYPVSEPCPERGAWHQLGDVSRAHPTVLHTLLPEQAPQDGFKVFLNLLPDQGAPGLLAIRHLYSTVGIYGVPLWDPLHRQWNDGKLGSKRQGYGTAAQQQPLRTKFLMCVLLLSARGPSWQCPRAGAEVRWQKPW